MPLRAVLGWMPLLPLPALGIGGIHALLFWVLAIGSGFANQVGLAGLESTTTDGFVANAFDPDRRTARQSVGPEHLQLVDLRGNHQPRGIPPRRLFAAGRELTQDVAPGTGAVESAADLFSSTPRLNTTTIQRRRRAILACRPP